MKKITFILFALIAGTTFSQNDAASSVGTADVFAEIVSPISITTTGSALDFGRIIGNADGGTVTVSTTSDRTASNNNLLAPSTTVQAATFNITAALDYNYSISIPTIDLAGGTGDAMAVTFVSSLGNENVLGTGASQTLTVGGTLVVNALQEEADYTGTVEVTVAYE